MASPSPAERVAAAVAAVKADLSWMYTDWSVRGPTLESSTALTAMAQEEIGHARVLNGLVQGELEGDRIPCLAEPASTWPELIGIVSPVELALASLTRALASCHHDGLRTRARKMAEEERFHQLFLEGWSSLLGADAAEIHDAFSAAIRRSQPETAAWVERLDALAAEGEILDAGALVEQCIPRLMQTGNADGG